MEQINTAEGDKQLEDRRAVETRSKQARIVVLVLR
jgi:hypothetical protein